tara:strand:- start:15 stop:221 length:207 start_codon:yes stop_codon:yes gene_type:complete
MSSKESFVVYDNRSHDKMFPMEIGALGSVLKSYDCYLKKKEIRTTKRIGEKKKPINTNETSSKYTNWH